MIIFTAGPTAAFKLKLIGETSSWNNQYRYLKESHTDLDWFGKGVDSVSDLRH